MAAATSAQSQGMKRWRNRAMAGNSKNPSTMVKPTWAKRSVVVGTMLQAAQR